MFIRTQKVYPYHACCIRIVQRQVRRGAHLGDSLAIHFFSTISGGLPLRVRPALAFKAILTLPCIYQMHILSVFAHLPFISFRIAQARRSGKLAPGFCHRIHENA